MGEGINEWGVSPGLTVEGSVRMKIRARGEDACGTDGKECGRGQNRTGTQQAGLPSNPHSQCPLFVLCCPESS